MATILSTACGLPQMLRECYVPVSDDDTPKVLIAFAKNLPRAGQRALISEIEPLKDDSAKKATAKVTENTFFNNIHKGMKAAMGAAMHLGFFLCTTQWLSHLVIIPLGDHPTW